MQKIKGFSEKVGWCWITSSKCLSLMYAEFVSIMKIFFDLLIQSIIIKIQNAIAQSHFNLLKNMWNGEKDIRDLKNLRLWDPII